MSNYFINLDKSLDYLLDIFHYYSTFSNTGLIKRRIPQIFNKLFASMNTYLVSTINIMLFLILKF